MKKQFAVKRGKNNAKFIIASLLEGKDDGEEEVEDRAE